VPSRRHSGVAMEPQLTHSRPSLSRSPQSARPQSQSVSDDHNSVRTVIGNNDRVNNHSNRNRVDNDNDTDNDNGVSNNNDDGDDDNNYNNDDDTNDDDNSDNNNRDDDNNDDNNNDDNNNDDNNNDNNGDDKTKLITTKQKQVQQLHIVLKEQGQIEYCMDNNILL